MIDFSRLCSERGIPFAEEGHHHCHEGWIQTHCPFCGDGTYGWHLGFNIEYGNMNCWKCGAKNVRVWLTAILPIRDRSQISAILREYEIIGYIPSIKEPIKTRKRHIKPPVYTEDMTKAHRKYLTQRNFDPEKLERDWGLQGTGPLSGIWKWRIIAPIKNIEGKIMAYTGRTICKDVKPRWKTTDEELMRDDPRRLIYGIDKADKKKGALIVEGPSDVWRMGFGAVGLLGIDWKIEQAGILRQFPRRFIMFDPAPEAQKRAEELAYWLAPLPGHTEILDGMESDPGDLEQGEANHIMREIGLK